MLQTETDLSKPAATSLDLSELSTSPVTELRLFKLSTLWFFAMEKMLIFLSYEPLAMCLPSYRSTMLVTAAS